eukprot:CAMPEP_0184520310 /NCGR_PEP_ID=MMETSP0198_2-20121128/7095_1 /TAXON_ID=1112570 /ORGANISM="Thraustochytrium sp., Strain LLF1b" /LENGTH=217 /DNA_ID=CAMNT_0026910891 /DNA_START=121 /DNA_END=774 /DNA_ORIENTATION=-
MSATRPSTRGTFVVIKHANQKRIDLSKLTKRTLGTGNLREAVRLPKNEKLEEWLATNCVDFYNEVSALYELCLDDAERFSEPGEGFPANFEYRWADEKSRKPKLIRCSSPQYVNYVLNWIVEQVYNEEVFPTEENAKFPKDFLDIAHKMLTRIFRVYAIIYHAHFKVIEAQKAASHLNTSFKHFVFFVYEHGIMEDKEYKALEEPVDRLVKQYNNTP